MDIKELRIGNIVNPSAFIEGDELQVRAISASGIIGLKNHHLACDISHIEGIQLSEECMKRFGLSKDLGSHVFRKGNFAVIFWPTELITVEFKNIEIRQIQYVHELQNLYFALTGTELETK